MRIFHMLRPHDSTEVTRRRARLAVPAFAAGLVVTPFAAWASHQFEDVPSTSPAHRAVTSVADAGLMTGSAGRFHPGRLVTRAALAQTLHRGLQRVRVDPTVSGIPVAGPDAPAIAETNMTIDGFQRGAQGVLLTFDMQVEPAQTLTADCTVTLIATSWPGNFDVGTWNFKMYAGAHRATTVSATFVAVQPADTTYTYELTAENRCAQPLHVIQGALTAQSAALSGNGSAFED